MENAGPILIVLVAPIILGAAGLWAIRFLKGDYQKKSPVSREIARFPGYSLSKRVESLSDSLDIYLTILVAVPAIVVAAGGAGVFADLTRPAFFALSAIYLGAVTVFLFFSFRIAANLINARRGLKGEQIVGNELNRLWRDGYQVLHDFPLELGNIDHVLVGPGGVFAVETKYRRKEKDREDAHIVRLAGDTLHFPGRKNKEDLRQALRQAEMLEQKLRKFFGPTPVQPVLVYPGWFVKCETERSSVVVADGQSAVKLIKKREAKLNDKQVSAIGSYLRDCVTDVEV